MASYNPPTENFPIFDIDAFVSNDEGLTIGYANSHYVKYPNAQGTVNLLTTNVGGEATFSNYTEFTDEVEFNTTTPPTCSAVQPASNDSSTIIPTTAWVQSVFNNIDTSNFVTLNGTQTVTGAKTFSQPIVCTGSITTGTQLTTKDYVDTSLGNLVSLSGTQTITGDKTFSQRVLCNGTITESNALTTKSYVDTAISNIDYSSLVNIAGTQTITGTKTFSQPITNNVTITLGTQLTNKTYVDGLISTTVKTTGAQTIGGIKTFSSTPVSSGGTPTTGTQLTTKSYVDTAISTAISGINYDNFVTLTGTQDLTGAKNFVQMSADDAYLDNIYFPNDTVQSSAYTGWLAAATYTNPTISFGVDGEITNIEDGDLSKIDSIQTTSTATTLDVKDTIQVIETVTTTKSIITPTQLSYFNGTSTVSADTSDIIAVGNLNGTIPSLSANQTFTGEIDFDAQTTFNNFAPHCSVVPTFGNDLTNKDYVDGLISSSIVGGGLATYLEFSQSSGVSTFKVLATSFDTSPSVSTTTNSLGTNTIASFITNANIPYIYNAGVVPAGLWNLAIYATTSSSQGTLNIKFTINKYNTTTSTKTLITTSGFSSDINSTSVSPDLYHCSATFPQTTFTTDERILIEIISVGVGMNAGSTITTYYEGDYYSYLTTSISSGAGIFSTNNVWSGTNTFNGATNTFSNALTCSNSVSTPTINNTTNSATLSIGTNQTGIISIGSASNSANQNLNGTWRATTKLQTPIIEGTSSAIDIKANTNGHITQATTRTDIYDTNIYLGELDNAGTITASVTNIGTNSFSKTGTNTVNIGYANPTGSSLNIRSKNVDFGGTSVLLPTTVNFNQYCDVEFAQAPLYTGTPLGLNDNSGLLATTAFVKGQDYAPSDSPVFTGTPTAPTPLTTDDSTKIATTEWVKNQGYTSGGDFLEKTSATAITLTAPSYDFQITGGNSISVNNNAIVPYSDIYYPPTSTIDLTPSTTMPNNRIVYLTGGTYTLIDPVETITATFIFQSTGINLVLGGLSPGFIDVQVGDIGNTITSICANQTITITRYTGQAANKWYITARNPAWLVDSASDVSVGGSANFTSIGKNVGSSVINGANITLGDTTNTVVLGLNSANDITLTAPVLEVPNTINQTTSGTMNLFTNLGTNILYINNTGGTGRTHVGNASGGTRLYGDVFTSMNISNIVPANNNNVYSTTTGQVSFANIASAINIGSGACGSINIGSTTQTGSTTIQANPTTGDVIIKNPLRIENTIALTSFNQIGYFYGTFTPTGYQNYSASGTNIKYASNTNPTAVTLPIGVYSLSACLSVNCSAGATAGVLGSITFGYSLGTANTYNNARQGILGLDDPSFFTSANTARTANASQRTITATITNTNASNYLSPYVAINITTAFTGGTIGVNINSFQITRIG